MTDIPVRPPHHNYDKPSDHHPHPVRPRGGGIIRTLSAPAAAGLSAPWSQW